MAKGDKQDQDDAQFDEAAEEMDLAKSKAISDEIQFEEE